jgi:hypothetical protein
VRDQPSWSSRWSQVSTITDLIPVSQGQNPRASMILPRRPCVRSTPVTRPAQPPEPSPDRAAVPPPLVVAASLVAVEAAMLVVFGVVELRSLETSKLTMGVTTSLFFGVYGAGLGFCGWQLYRLRSWTRAPVVLAQLIQLGVAWSFREGATTFVSVLLTVVALVVLAGIFHPAALRALAQADGEDQTGPH